MMTGNRIYPGVRTSFIEAQATQNSQRPPSHDQAIKDDIEEADRTFKDFIKKKKLKGVKLTSEFTPITIYHCSLEVLGQQDRKITVEEPYEGGYIDGPLDSEAEVHNTMTLTPAVTTSPQRTKIPHTEEVVDCYECSATGKTKCKKCDGDKKVKCSACENGFISQRSSCSDCYSSYPYNDECDTCGRRYGERNDEIICNVCGGSGSVCCEDCKGKGLIDCSHCNGHQQLKIYQQLETTKLARRFGEYTECGIAKEILGKLDGRELKNSADVAPLCKAEVERIFQQLKQRSKGEYTKIVKQSEIVEEITLYKAYYSYKDEISKCWIYYEDNNMKVHAPALKKSSKCKMQ